MIGSWKRNHRELHPISIRTKIVLITIVILFSATAINTFITSAVFAKGYADSLQSETFVIGQSLKFQLDRLLRLEIPLHDIVGFEKQCQDIVDSYETIAYALVMDTDGQILFHNEPSQQGQIWSDPATLRALQSGEKLIQSLTLNGIDYYDVSIPVFNAHDEQIAVVRTGFPIELITQETRMIITISVGVTFVSLLLAGGLLVVGLSVWVINPLGKFVDAIQEIKDQGTDVATEVAIHSKDEIGQLASVFNEMLADLRKSHEEINIYTQKLETKVAKRTAELNRLNEALQLDIKERERMGEALQAFAAKLEHSNQELEQFAYVASHDLQEPLRKVKVFGERLKDKYSDVLDEHGLNYLNRMQNAADRMQKLIEGLLNYSRITTKAQPFVETDLAQIAREVISDLEMRIEQVGGTVEIGDLPVIEADPLQMRQLLQNLISNGLKFHKETTHPWVKVEGQFLNGAAASADPDSPANKTVQLTIADNGIGFDEKYTERIFQAFQRLHGRSQFEGTGIGLATCRKIAERHGGAITAKSSPGEGATFIVTLPAKHTIVQEAE